MKKHDAGEEEKKSQWTLVNSYQLFLLLPFFFDTFFGRIAGEEDSEKEKGTKRAGPIVESFIYAKNISGLFYFYIFLWPLQKLLVLLRKPTHAKEPGQSSKLKVLISEKERKVYEIFLAVLEMHHRSKQSHVASIGFILRSKHQHHHQCAFFLLMRFVALFFFSVALRKYTVHKNVTALPQFLSNCIQSSSVHTLRLENATRISTTSRRAHRWGVKSLCNRRVVLLWYSTTNLLLLLREGLRWFFLLTSFFDKLNCIFCILRNEKKINYFAPRALLSLSRFAQCNDLTAFHCGPSWRGDYMWGGRQREREKKRKVRSWRNQQTTNGNDSQQLFYSESFSCTLDCMQIVWGVLGR